MFSDTFLAEYRNDYLDEDRTDESDTNATPPSLISPSPISSQPSRTPPSSPSPFAIKSHTLPKKSMPGWDMCKTMCHWQADGTGLEQAIAAADAAMPLGGLPVASERAGGDGRRAGLKRKAEEITRSAAEDFTLPNTCTSSMRYAADFLSTVANVSFSDIYI